MIKSLLKEHVMYLVKNGEIYHRGEFMKKDILIGGKQILRIADSIDFEDSLAIKTIDAAGKKVLPGLIDGHVHICGGGGEGGFKTRTPELKMTDMIRAGVTTVVGCLGTDGVSRSMEGLVAKMYGLREEGVSAYCYTGSYRLPLKTVTGDIMKDIMMIEGIIGIGEVAISDHRSAHASRHEFAKAVSDARVAGKLASKCGICNVHLGDAQSGLDPILALLKDTAIPITQFLPTHMNRNQHLFDQAIGYAKDGGYVDFTTSTTEAFIEEGEIAAPEAMSRMLDAGVPVSRMTLTSDGQGSLPAFDADGNLTGLTIGSLASLFDAVKSCHDQYGVAFEEVIKTVTENPATILKLKGKGFLEESYDADILIVDESFGIETVISMGQLMMFSGELLVKDTF
ncbi:beta-aspartyl-peptidase [Fusibacter sp. A1]|nr:beta-aspartyl-peptidase [Fusibacter sp. A1]RXV62028.1 beta-aspartyl-peptidase [Fusibacter sp. A1]